MFCVVGILVVIDEFFLCCGCFVCCVLMLIYVMCW